MELEHQITRLVLLALEYRKAGKTSDPRYPKIIQLLKNHHANSPDKVKAIMERVHQQDKNNSNNNTRFNNNNNAGGRVVQQQPPPVIQPLPQRQSSNIIFEEKHLKRLRQQIDLYKTLCTAMAQALNGAPSKPPAIAGSASLPPPQSATAAAQPSSKKLAGSTRQPSTAPLWRRAELGFVYLGPPECDGNRIPLPSTGFGEFNVGNWSLALDMQGIYDEVCKKEKAPVWKKAQEDLRRQVSQMHRVLQASKGEPLAIDRKSYRRVSKQSREDTKADERDARKRYIDIEKERRLKHQGFLRAIINHSRDFSSFHRNKQQSVAKLAKAVKSVVDQKAQRAEREEDRQEKLRLKALKSNDMEAYSKLVAEAKNERLTYLLKQTDGYLDSIRDLVKQHHQKHHVSAHSTEDSDLDYLGIAQSGELPRQPHMLVGGDLKEYQLRGLQWMVSLYDNRLNGILADEMGLGKTIQTIALITHVMEVKHNNGPFLVVVPLSTMSNWVNEFRKWAPDVNVVVYKGIPQARKDIYRDEMASCQFNLLLTTYEYIMKDKAVLRKYQWQYVVVDEGHRLKNAQSKFAQTLGTMYTSRNRILLTGTPLQNSLPELWALLNFLLPSIFSSVDTFEQWFSKPFASFSGTGETNELNDEERMVIINRLHRVLRPFLLRRVKANVLDQLPQKVERVLKCDLSGWQKILYRRIQEGGSLLVDPSAPGGSRNVGSRGLSNIIMQLRKVCNHPYLFQLDAGYSIDFTIVRCAGKFELLDRMLPKLKAGGHRVLMFSQMTQLMTILEDYFTWRGYRYLRLDGSTSADEREQRMFMYNAADSPHFIFLLSTRAGGLGLNLATADTVILFDSDWNPAMDAQAQDRAHRIGQKNDVRVFRLVTNSPIEEKILSRATDKLNMNNLIVEAGKFNSKSKEAERKAMLESLIKLESEDVETGDSSALDDDQLNEMMALTDGELELYKRMDKERAALELSDWEEMKKNNSQLSGPIPSRLMEEKDAPEWLLKADQQMEDRLIAEASGTASKEIGPRKRKDISYRQMSDAEFGNMLEKGERGEFNGENLMETSDSVVVDQTNVENDDDYIDEVPEGKGAKRKLQSDVDVNLIEVYCQQYRSVLKAVKENADETGRKRSVIFLQKPQKSLYPDYYVIIKKPIALDGIRRKIDQRKYDSHESFEADFQLMFDNAKTYNHPDSWVYKDALELEALVAESMKTIRSLDYDSLVADFVASGGIAAAKGGKGKKKRRKN